VVGSRLERPVAGVLVELLPPLEERLLHDVLELVVAERASELRVAPDVEAPHARHPAQELVDGNTHVNGAQDFTKPGVPWITSTDDLPVTIDIRDIQGELIQDATGVAPSVIFPDSAYQHLDHGLIT
jgi:hypothetical protein